MSGSITVAPAGIRGLIPLLGQMFPSLTYFNEVAEIGNFRDLVEELTGPILPNNRDDWKTDH